VIRQNQAGTILTRLIELVIGEASTPRFGSESVIERLCDGLFVLVIRFCIEENLVREGVFAAMQDKRLAKALGLIHERPLAGLDTQRVMRPGRRFQVGIVGEIFRADRLFSHRISNAVAFANRRSLADGTEYECGARGGKERLRVGASL